MSSLINTIENKQNILLFDFDGTLFDTTALKNQISFELQKYTQNTDLLWDIEKRLRDKRFHLIETMKVFCEQLGITDIKNKIQNIFLEQNFPNFVFTDVSTSLPELKKNCSIALFSQGDETYQQVKIQLSKISEFADFMYIFHHKLHHLTEVCSFFPDKQVWLIDNHLHILEKAKKINPLIKTVWLNREQLQKNSDFTADYEFQNVTQMLPLFC